MIDGHVNGDSIESFRTASMTDVTELLEAMERGNAEASEQLLPLVYHELRRLAKFHLANEKPGQTLQATALVHEAYLRLVGNRQHSQNWSGTGHFYAAAAESMRRILVENARRKNRLKRGAGMKRVDVEDVSCPDSEIKEDLIALDEALKKLATVDDIAAKLVHFRYFAGLSFTEAAEILHISVRTAGRKWAYARAWLQCEIQESYQPSK